MNELMNNEIKMNHVELCELINKLRAEEGNRKELAQRDFIKKIRKELETMKSLGLEGVRNFSHSYFTDSQGKKHSTYLMNRDAILQMAASESVYVRAKVIEYINALENKLKEKDSYMIDDPVQRALKWAEEEKERQALKIENKELKQEIEELEEYKMFKNMINNSSIEGIPLGELGIWMKSNTNLNIGRNKIFKFCKDNGLVRKSNYDGNNYAKDYSVRNNWMKNQCKFSYRPNGEMYVSNKIIVTKSGILYLGKKLFEEQLKKQL